MVHIAMLFVNIVSILYKLRFMIASLINDRILISIISNISSLFINTVLSFFASFLAWWIVTNAILPRVSIGNLYKQVRENKTPIYRVRIYNNSPFFDVVDINLSGRVNIKGLNPDDENEITPYRLLIGYENPTYIRHAGSGDNYWQPSIRIPNKSDLNLDYCKIYKKDSTDFRVSIEDLQNLLKSNSYTIEVSIECSHNIVTDFMILIRRIFIDIITTTG